MSFRNRLRSLGWIALLIVVLTGLGFVRAVYVRLTEPERVRRQAEDYLQQYFNAPVVVGAAAFTLRDGVHLYDVAVGSAPEVADSSSRPVFYCRDVEASVRFSALLRGNFTVDSVVAEEPSLTIVRRAGDGATNIRGLIRPEAFAARSNSTELPRIELRDANVRVLQREDGRERLIENLALTFRGRSAERSPRFYDIVWHRFGPEPASGHSQVDLETYRVRNVYGGLPWISLEAVMIAVNARYDAVGAWYDLLGMSGSVRASDYALGGPEGDDRSATLELDDATIAIPLTQDGPARPPTERYLRFEGVFGQLTLSEEGVRAVFEGRFHGSRCRATAFLSGNVQHIATLDDVDFDVQIVIDGLELPRPAPEGTPSQQRFIDRWPKLARFYQNFDPAGLVDVEIEASKRAGLDEPVQVRRWMVRAINAHATARYFPYRVHHLTGVVEAQGDGIDLRELSGVHGAGEVRVDGWFSHSGPESQAWLDIRGSGIPIDQELCSAVAARYLDVCELYAPQGTADINVQLSRPEAPPGVRSMWDSTTQVALNGASIMYRDFPYPIDNITGVITGEKGVWSLDELVGTAGDGQVCLSGRVVSAPQVQASTAVKVEAENIAIDDTLLAAVSPEVRKSLAAFHAEGTIDVYTTIARGASDAATLHYSDVVLNGARIRHDDFPLPVEHVTGNIRILPGRVAFTQLRGQSGLATFSASGQVLGNWNTPSADMTITATGLTMDEQLRAALPRNARRALEDWSVQGSFAAEVDIQRASHDAGNQFTARVYLNGNELRHADLPLPVKDVRAVVALDASGMRASGASARIGPTQVIGDMSLDQGPGGAETGQFVFKASNLVLDGAARALLPRAQRVAWDRLGLSGSVDLEVDRLAYTRAAPSAPRVWTLDGRVHLFDVALESPARMHNLAGVVTVSGTLFDARGDSMLRGRLALERGALSEKRIQNVRTPWSYAAGGSSAKLSLQDIRGEVYGGSLTGSVDWRMDGERAIYDVAAMLHGMQLYEFLNANKSIAEEPIDAHGLLDARLQMSGIAGEPSSRREAVGWRYLREASIGFPSCWAS